MQNKAPIPEPSKPSMLPSGNTEPSMIISQAYLNAENSCFVDFIIVLTSYSTYDLAALNTCIWLAMTAKASIS